VFIAPQIAARLKRTQHVTINMLTPAVARQSYGAAGKRVQAAVLVATQIAARLKQTQHSTISMITLAVARQSYDAAGRRDRQ
jgi:ribosomal protein L18